MLDPDTLTECVQFYGLTAQYLLLAAGTDPRL